MWRVGQSDDREAFEELMARWHARVHALGTRMLGDAFAAEDVAQEVFQRLHQHRGRYQPTARFSTYLWRIALNRCHDELRRLGSRAAWRTDPVDASADLEGPVASPLISSVPGPDEVTRNREEWTLVQQALQTLSPALRSVVVLRHYHDLKLREIAEVLDVPEGTVCSRLAEALDQLARQLSAPLERHHAGRARAARSMPPPRPLPSPFRHE